MKGGSCKEKVKLESANVNITFEGIVGITKKYKDE